MVKADAITPEAFELKYATARRMTVTEFRACYVVLSCNCDSARCQGWIAMLKDQAEDMVKLFPDLHHFVSPEAQNPLDLPEYPDLDERRCRECGCTDYNACFDERRGEPCHWVEADLCSNCEP